MRFLLLLLTTSIAVGGAIASAQTVPAPPVTPAAAPSTAPASDIRIGEIDFGGRVTSISGNQARFQRYRDLRDGPTLDRLRYTRDTAAWTFVTAVDHTGYRDQRYAAAFDRYGKAKMSVEWDQVPLFYSTDTRTPFRAESEGVFRLNDSAQAAIQGGASIPVALAPEIQRFDLRSRRHVADLRGVYAVTPRLDLSVSFTSTGRSGAQPWGVSFGQSLAVEVPVPIDQRTNDLNATVEWSNQTAMARLAYDGSWFSNATEVLVLDNPQRVTDQIGGPSQGRMALWPDSTAHTVSATGSLVLPARSRALAYVSVGSWLQDQALLPFTINAAITPIPLARTSAEADARIVSMTYRLTSRPTRTLWLSGQFKRYDYDNRTPHFAVGQYVQYDTTVATSATGGSEPFGYTRNFVDLDASYTPTQLRFAAFRLGYGREQDDRTFRFLDQTTEQTVRGSIDSTGLTWGSMRVQYDHAVRTGTGLDEQAFSDIGEQVSLRQFDISDRTRDRVTAIVQVAPVETLGLNASLGAGREHRPGATFGLQDNDVVSVTVGADATPNDAVVLGTSLGLERYTTLQRSRQANPGVQFDDPTRDWSTDMHEDVRTFTANLDLPHVTPRTTLRVAYDNVWSRARYLYLLPSNSTLTPPVQLSPVRNQIQRASADLRHTLGRQLALGLGYAYEKYDVEDFALSPGTLNSPLFTTFIDLMYQFRPYAAHTGSARLIYTW